MAEVERRHPGTLARTEQRRRQRGELGNQLYLARLRHALTQVELAEQTGIAQSDISAYENGDGNPTAATLQRLANALGIEITIRPEGDQAA
jgi:transcriptional regulator with XRE-family HTH domain